MKFKLTKYILLAIIAITMIFIGYNYIKPMIIKQSMAKNYFSKEKEFQRLETFLEERAPALFPGESDLINKAVISSNQVNKQLFDSLYTFLGKVNCKDIYKYSMRGSDKKFILVYHNEFLFPAFVYLIVVGSNKPLPENWKPDGFVNSNWIDKQVLAGTLKWN